jgi:hypothetical protein
MGIVETTRKTDEMQRVYYALLCGGSWPYSSPKLNTNTMNEISDIRRAHIDYMWADERSDAFKKAKALLERVHEKWGTTNPDTIRNLTK